MKYKYFPLIHKKLEFFTIGVECWVFPSDSLLEIQCKLILPNIPALL